MSKHIDWSTDGPEIIRFYCEEFLSSNDLVKFFPQYKRTTIREFIKRQGLIRSQSEASSLAIMQGKKNKAIELLIKSAKTDNRFNPLKGHPKEKHPKWIKDRSKVKQKRMFTEEKWFFAEIFKERNYTCEISGERGNKLSIHHIKPVFIYPDLQFNKENVIVIRKDIHDTFHYIYGMKATQKDWEVFYGSIC